MVLKLQGPNQRAIIVGMNEQGNALADRIRQTPYSRVELVGFVDSRAQSRLAPMGDNKLLGKLDDLATRLGLTRERIRQIQLEALAKVKRDMARHGVDRGSIF